MTTDKELTGSISGIREKIIRYYGYLEENTMKQMALKCSKMTFNEHFEIICSGKHEEPTYKEMEDFMLEEIWDDFDEKVAEVIQRVFPYLSEDEVDLELLELEKSYKDMHAEQIETATRMALKDFRSRVNGLRKDLQALRRKYTM